MPWKKFSPPYEVTIASGTGKNCDLHHGRTESVSSLVLAVGRSSTGLGSKPTGESPRLLIVAAIPEAMNNEYLRILGAISRVCREENCLRALLNAERSDSFLAALEKGCLQ